MGRANWAERIKTNADRVIKLPDGLAFEHAAMLKANPPSAHFMLKDYVDLTPGDWVVQNAANSAVGRHLIRFAQARGFHTVNIVRRQSLVTELRQHGGDVVIVDGDDLAQRVRAATGTEAPIRLGIDAIGGTACQRLADCLSDGGVLVNYGFLSGDPCMITPHQAIVRDITLKGFWLMRVMQTLSRDRIEALYAEMAGYFMDGTLDVPIEAEYGLSDAKAALAHAWQPGRDGKIMFTPTHD
jgi:NADPH:quinone reductase-like Zn-dependent oxidoreductase